MQVFTCPIEIMCNSDRVHIQEFLEYVFVHHSAKLEMLEGSCKRHVAYNFSDGFYSSLIITRRVPRYACELNDIDNGLDIQLERKDYQAKDGDFNLLLLKEDSMESNSIKGVYTHYSGSFSRSDMIQLFQREFRYFVRSKFIKMKRGEKLEIKNIVDDESLLNKIRRLSRVDGVSMTFERSRYKDNGKMKALNPLEKSSDSVHIEYRKKGLFDKATSADEDLLKEIDEISRKPDCSSISVYGLRDGLNVEGTVNIIMSSNYISVEEHSAVLGSLNGYRMSNFTLSPFYTETKEKILTGQYSHLFLK